jgi:hypothetical protein
MKNFWLERKKKSKIAMWDFESALKDANGELVDAKYVKVFEVNNLHAKRYQRIELFSTGGYLIASDKLVKEYPKIYGWKTPEKHSFTFVDDDKIVVAPYCPKS